MISESLFDRSKTNLVLTTNEKLSCHQKKRCTHLVFFFRVSIITEIATSHNSTGPSKKSPLIFLLFCYYHWRHCNPGHRAMVRVVFLPPPQNYIHKYTIFSAPPEVIYIRALVDFSPDWRQCV